jgi:hypothetical protein
MAGDNLAQYPLQRDGSIHHWLACGPITAPLTHLSRVIESAGSPLAHASPMNRATTLAL